MGQRNSTETFRPNVADMLDLNEPLVDAPNPRDLFLSQKNIQDVVKMAFILANNHGYHPIATYFQQQMPGLMAKWASERCIQRFEVSAGDIADWYQTLEFMNKIFIEESKDKILGLPLRMDGDPYTELQQQMVMGDMLLGGRNPRGKIDSGLTVTVGTLNEFENSRRQQDYSNMTAEDYQTLDVWAPVGIYFWDRCPKSKATDDGSCNFRCASPTWASGIKRRFWVQQETGRFRHYDKDNEGLRDTKEHSERPTHLRGFDMSEIYKVADRGLDQRS